MDPREQLKEHLLQKLSLRIGDEMAEYLHRRMTSAFADKPVPVIARDARTGQPRAVTLSRSDLPAGNWQLSTGNSPS